MYRLQVRGESQLAPMTAFLRRRKSAREIPECCEQKGEQSGRISSVARESLTSFVPSLNDLSTPEVSLAKQAAW